MVRKGAYKKYLILIGSLFLLLSLPACFIEVLRGKTIALLCPLWKFKGTVGEVSHAKKVEVENLYLREEIKKLCALLEENNVIASCGRELNLFKDNPLSTQKNCFLMGLLVSMVPAKVIHRDPSSYRSSLWLNIGSETNTHLKRNVVGKNSPVILGRAVVGAIDYVGKKQSRVRLISDSGLTPSVRAVRGGIQALFLRERLDALLRTFSWKKEEATGAEKEWVETLKKLRDSLPAVGETHYLAKGYVEGEGKPLWRSKGNILKGKGFNYDFSDERGEAKELRQPILKVGDLLITTGMDGVFPEGLFVGEVVKVYPLKEGATTYSLDAEPAAPSLDELSTLFVLPPLECINEETIRY